jgi:SRP-independent targeting protein 2/TMEM208
MHLGRTFNIFSLQLFFIFTSVIFTGCYMFMQMMARASLTETGQLLDAGLDLNMQDGIAEYENIYLQYVKLFFQKFK